MKWDVGALQITIENKRLCVHVTECKVQVCIDSYIRMSSLGNACKTVNYVSGKTVDI